MDIDSKHLTIGEPRAVTVRSVVTLARSYRQAVMERVAERPSARIDRSAHAGESHSATDIRHDAPRVFAIYPRGIGSTL